jgi:hopene-associated glycosyltransferase HpnB
VLGLAIACVISAAAWVYLVTWHGGFWLTSQRLPPLTDAEGPQSWPSVVAVVPARNEADALPVTLPDLLAQDYPGEFRVFLVDDGSDDGTAAIAAELGEKAARAGGAPLTVVNGRARPPGWAGKVWAMSQGLSATEAVGARYVLFTDADISWAPGALRELVTGAESDDRALVSQMALLRAETFWERVIVPAFVYFFAQLYPFRKVSAPRDKTAAAAGGCMLVSRQALAKAGGIERIRGALIDDVALGTLLKRNGNRVWLGLTTDVRSSRPYPTLASLWHMIARSAYVQLRYNPVVLLGTIVGLLLLYIAPPAGAIGALIALTTGTAGTGAIGTETAVAGAAGLVGWALMTVSYVPMLRFYRLSPLRAPALPLIALGYAAMTADSARRHYSGRAVAWRGRAAARV